MPVTIRPADPAADYGRLAELWSAVSRQPVTAANLREWDAVGGPETISRRAAAVDAAGAVIGGSVVVRHGWVSVDRCRLWLTVDAARRGPGIGARLYDDALAFARSLGARRLDSDVHDDDPAALRFAEKRGFTVDRHAFASVIELAAFDEAPFAGLVEAVAAGGIRFLTLADVGESDDWLRRLHALNAQAVAADPASTDEFPPFEDFRALLFGASWYRPEGQIMAVDGSGGEPAVVGLAAVGYDAAANTMHNNITGVDRAYRGRRIAQALKLLTIRYARAVGAAAIYTENDSTNAPMLAVNRRLGYRPLPGDYRLVAHLD